MYLDVEKVLSYLQEERSLFESRQKLPVSYGAFGDNINEEIVEHWNDKDLNKWRGKSNFYSNCLHFNILAGNSNNSNYYLTIDGTGEC